MRKEQQSSPGIKHSPAQACSRRGGRGLGGREQWLLSNAHGTQVTPPGTSHRRRKRQAGLPAEQAGRAMGEPELAAGTAPAAADAPLGEATRLENTQLTGIEAKPVLPPSTRQPLRSQGRGLRAAAPLDPALLL